MMPRRADPHPPVGPAGTGARGSEPGSEHARVSKSVAMYRHVPPSRYPPPRLLYRRRPSQIFKISKDPAYGTLPGTSHRPHKAYISAYDALNTKRPTFLP